MSEQPISHVVCPHCSAVNRIPDNRLADKPNCGKCKQALFTGEPQNLTQSTMAKVIANSDLPVVVDFWAPWCGPCQMMGPMFSQMASELEPNVRMAKVNTEQEQQLGAQFGIRSIPTLAIFKGGKEVARQSGVMQPAQLKAWIQANS
ncbi:thioredoxin TrxC [Oceanospirillum sp.]|uniref:thioredoxin TrxC n=1 Tax=Oceanospirillum sp. TaxID=2021254 RepID=UPI003A8F3C9A